MSGFAGFTNYTYRRESTELVLKQMSDTIIKRGIDVEAYYDDRYTHVAYRSRNIKNMSMKKKAMNYIRGDNEYVIFLDGEICNKTKIIAEEKIEMETNEDEELILKLYDKYGEKFIEKLSGLFSFAIWNKGKQTLYLAQDSFGTKPLFYMIQDSNFIFSSEVKAILQFPDVNSYITEYGIASIFLKGILSVKSKPFFKGVQELGAGEYLICKPNKIRKEKYIAPNLDKIVVPLIRPVERKILLTKGEIRNIVKTKDSPDRILQDALIIKECEKISDVSIENNLNVIKENKWNSNFELRKKLISPELKINLEEFYNFQRNKIEESTDYNSIDKISNRFGYNLIVPQMDYVIDEENIRNIFTELIDYNDAPIWDFANRDAALKLKDEIDFDTISYLIEIDMWLEEYRVKIR